MDSRDGHCSRRGFPAGPSPLLITPALGGEQSECHYGGSSASPVVLAAPPQQPLQGEGTVPAAEHHSNYTCSLFGSLVPFVLLFPALFSFANLIVLQIDFLKREQDKETKMGCREWERKKWGWECTEKGAGRRQSG